MNPEEQKYLPFCDVHVIGQTSEALLSGIQGCARRVIKQLEGQ